MSKKKDIGLGTITTPPLVCKSDSKFCAFPQWITTKKKRTNKKLDLISDRKKNVSYVWNRGKKVS